MHFSHTFTHPRSPNSSRTGFWEPRKVNSTWFFAAAVRLMYLAAAEMPFAQHDGLEQGIGVDFSRSDAIFFSKFVFHSVSPSSIVIIVIISASNSYTAPWKRKLMKNKRSGEGKSGGVSLPLFCRKEKPSASPLFVVNSRKLHLLR